MKAAIVARLFLACLLLSLVTACFPKGGVKTTREKEGEIRAVEVHDSSGKTEIVVEGPQPMIYTSFQLSDPSRLVVDMAGVAFGSGVSEVAVNNGVVTTVSPKAVEGAKIARLEIGLNASVEPTVRTEGTRLIVELAKGAEAKAAPASGTPEAPVPAAAPSEPRPDEPSGGESPPAAPPQPEKIPLAKSIKGIKVSQAETLSVKVNADGDLNPQVFYLGKNRLVLDFVGIQTSMKPKLIPIQDNPRVKRIRIGKHPDRVRLVADLTRPVSYRMEHGKDGLSLFIGNQEGTAPGGAPSASAAIPVALAPAPPADQKAGPAPQTEGSPAAPVEPSGAIEKETKEVQNTATASEPTAPPAAAAGPGESAQGGDSAPRPPSDEETKEKPARKQAPKGKVTLENGLSPMASSGTGPHHFVGRRISLDFQDADITNVIRLIADVSGLNIVLGEDVKGKVTLKLVNVPWDQALDIILRMNNLGQLREGNIVRIATLANITRQQDEEARAKETQVKAEDLTTMVIRLNYSDAKRLLEPLKKNLSSRGELTVDDRTNSLIVKDISRYLEQVSALVKTLDLQTPQVMIEARVVQVNPTFDQSLGIQWGGNVQSISNSTVTTINGVQSTTGPAGVPFGVTGPDFAVNLPASSSQGALGFTLGRFTGNPFNLDLRISAGEVRGLTKIVSTPKISVLDNQEARIEEGESIPYSTVSASGTQTIFVDASLVLSVKPHITGDRSIILVLKVSKDAPGDTRQGAAGPSIFKKEASTNILMKDGETTVIGGIYETTEVRSVSGVPFLMRIPFLGWLFKTEDRQQQKTELLVFITPRIVS